MDLRQCRVKLGLSQAEFARRLDVPLETYRTWDSGRRQVPEWALAAAKDQVTLQSANDRLYPLSVVAALVSVHVRTLRNAARDGRMRVSYDTRTTFRRLRMLASISDALLFKRDNFRRRGHLRADVRPSWSEIPADYDRRIRAIREELGKSQAGFAALIGAARKAVVYQWESRKRCPSPVFWRRIIEVASNGTQKAS
jgi:DNA-binding transcriptional regulator YiaG